MFYEWLYPLKDSISAFNLFKYITFRTGGAVMTAMVIAFVFGGPFIRWIKAKQGKGQPIRDDGPESHILEKAGTPTMGGLLILIPALLATLLWMDWQNIYVWAVLLVTVGYGVLGFMDDYAKVTKQSTAGVSGKMKLLVQFLIAFVAIGMVVMFGPLPPEELPDYKTSLALPIFKDTLINLGMFYFVFAGFVIVGASNAVNLTDGLDGLAIVPVMIAAASFGLISYLVGNYIFANYLGVHFTPGAGEITIFCGALVGAGLGFLWFNAPPAMIFMGDTGSLSLGGALGMIAVAVKHEIVLAIIGGLFVLEAVSVMVQVASFKLTGKRVFRMAPIHHHFEKKGWKEPTVVIRFWIIAVILAMIGLSTLKLR